MKCRLNEDNMTIERTNGDETMNKRSLNELYTKENVLKSLSIILRFLTFFSYQRIPAAKLTENRENI